MPQVPGPFSTRVGDVVQGEACPGLRATHPNVRVPVTGSVGYREEGAESAPRLRVPCSREKSLPLRVRGSLCCPP